MVSPPGVITSASDMPTLDEADESLEQFLDGLRGQIQVERDGRPVATHVAIAIEGSLMTESGIRPLVAFSSERKLENQGRVDRLESTDEDGGTAEETVHRLNEMQALNGSGNISLLDQPIAVNTGTVGLTVSNDLMDMLEEEAVSVFLERNLANGRGKVLFGDVDALSAQRLIWSEVLALKCDQLLTRYRHADVGTVAVADADEEGKNILREVRDLGEMAWGLAHGLPEGYSALLRMAKAITLQGGSLRDLHKEMGIERTYEGKSLGAFLREVEAL